MFDGIISYMQHEPICCQICWVNLLLGTFLAQTPSPFILDPQLIVPKSAPYLSVGKFFSRTYYSNMFEDAFRSCFI